MGRASDLDWVRSWEGGTDMTASRGNCHDTAADRPGADEYGSWNNYGRDKHISDMRNSTDILEGED